MAVQEAQRRISPALKKVQKRTHITWFSRLDFWDYHAIFDTKLCDLCAKHAMTAVFAGSDLRGIFPYLEIKDDNTIEVNVHPNCRCYLTRKLEKEED